MHSYATISHLAENPHTPPHILSELSSGSGGIYGKLESRIISHAKITLQKLEEKKQDSNSDVGEKNG